MIDTKNIYLFVGASGSGKSAIVDELEKQHDLVALQSYTTRPKRHEYERGHTFVRKSDFSPDMLPDCIAFTVYNDNYYWATIDQVDRSDLYVVDPAGLNVLRAKYRGDKQLKVINVTAVKPLRKRRMRDRGTPDGEVDKRLLCDEVIFSNITADFSVDNSVQGLDGLQECVDRVWEFICKEEGITDEKTV